MISAPFNLPLTTTASRQEDSFPFSLLYFLSGAAKRKVFREIACCSFILLGFVAKPETLPDGSVNLMIWLTILRRQASKPQEMEDGKLLGLIGKVVIIHLQFTSVKIIQMKPPKCKFPPGFFHPNVYPSGTVCLSILNEDSGWRPAITVKQILVGIQDLLDQPNPADPAQTEGYHMFIQDSLEYRRGAPAV
ncbi:SUMO-conjugating enzyme sce1 [Datura stramonium]|uniref:SUMO-conjugating enzyme sce1 n=1 Tax=Datura stramonium TaxID=4076 RepID=A0ABS8S848_DATST|nr:SUMO-conjugating enzyme sce1 [Datura stramonium]